MITEKDFEKFYKPSQRIHFNYIPPEKVLSQEIIEILSPDLFLEEMIEREVIDYITGIYSEDCFSLCNNSVAWALKQLHFFGFETDDFKAIEGSFYRPNLPRMEHSWLKYKEFYIDLTLAQFIKDAPKLAIVSAIDTEIGYNTWKELTIEEYIYSLIE